MTVYKCDRCGTVFEKVPSPIDITMLTDRTRKIAITSHFPIETIRDYTGTVDLCPECLRDIAAFMSDPTTEVKTATSGLPKELIENVDETFDIVDAFIHLIRGMKVRWTTWIEDEYIRIVYDTDTGNVHLVTKDDKPFPAEYMFKKSYIEARWEEYKEKE